MLPSYQKEYIEWIIEGRANHNYFSVIFLGYNHTTWKSWLNFFKMQSISILAIRR